MTQALLEMVAVIWSSLTFIWAVSWYCSELSTDYFCCNHLFTESLVTSGIHKRLTKRRDFSSDCCHQAVSRKKDTRVYLAQSEGLQIRIFCLKCLFPFCLEVNGIYQDQLGGAYHISWSQQILDFAFWNQKSQVSFQCSTMRTCFDCFFSQFNSLV